MPEVRDERMEALVWGLERHLQGARCADILLSLCRRLLSLGVFRTSATAAAAAVGPHTSSASAQG